MTTLPTNPTRYLTKPPQIAFRKSTKGRGVVGPFGEVLIFKIDQEELPVYVAATGGAAVMDFTGRSALVRFGTGASAITLTTQGIQYGQQKIKAWSKAAVKELIGALSKNPKQSRNALLLRAALHATYPVAIVKAGVKMGVRMANHLAKSVRDFGVNAMECTVNTVTETVVEKVTERVQVVLTAEKQFQQCYDTEIRRSPCKDALLMAGACAAALCAAKAFVDMVVGMIEVVSEITREVAREVVACAAPKADIWPNPWNGGLNVAAGVVPQKALGASKATILEALILLKKFDNILSPFGKCLLEGQWSLAQLETPLNLGGKVVVPYGVKVCITADCANQLALDQVFFTSLQAWGAALGVLAALSPEFAAMMVGTGVVAAPAVTAAIAGVAPAVVHIAAIIFAFVLLALIYSTAVSAQLAYHKNFTNNFADGKVCIEHPTFALALIKLATLTLVPAELVPPIVTG